MSRNIGWGGYLEYMNKTDKSALEQFLKIRRWKSYVNPLGEVSYISPDSQFCVEIGPHGWCSVGTSDIDGEAVDGYVTQGEPETLKELKEELLSLGALQWECPYCGEPGGEPYTVSWTEYQGESPHGGLVTFQDERCTNCVRTERSL
jgi:hypothetical protein